MGRKYQNVFWVQKSRFAIFYIHTKIYLEGKLVSVARGLRPRFGSQGLFKVNKEQVQFSTRKTLMYSLH